MLQGDTIAAISSSAQASARIIVRVSGPLAHEIAQKICDELKLEPSTAQSVKLCFTSLTVPAVVYLFAGPHSYTAEDLVEFHIPGNALLARLLLDEIIQRGARPAEPGEFTARSYFNGRIGLTEAEGVAATINAQNQSELRAARQLLSGELSRRLSPMLASLIETLALVEAGIDFSDEDINFISSADVMSRVKQIDDALDELVRSSARFERLSHEPQIVLVGRPNAGKSTLLNALAGHERAIVSPIAGTTRDALSAEVRLARGIVRIIDVAGVDETSNGGEIELQMTAQALRAMEIADRVVLVRDVNDVRTDPPLSRPADLVIETKADLRSDAPADAVSATTGKNLDELRSRLDVLAFGEGTGASLALNARHLRAINNARAALHRINEELNPELIAAELRASLDSLGEVLGQVSPDDVLTHVFSTFCIGK